MRSVGTPRAWDPEVIDQAIPQIEEPYSGHRSGLGGEPPVPLSPADMQAWTGERFATKDGGELDRSDTLYWIGCGVARGLRSTDLSKSAKRSIIEEALVERDEALGYRKYAARGDAATQYATIADRALQDVASQPVARISMNGSRDQTQAEQKSPFEGRGPGVTKLLADAMRSRLRTTSPRTPAASSTATLVEPTASTPNASSDVGLKRSSRSKAPRISGARTEPMR